MPSKARRGKRRGFRTQPKLTRWQEWQTGAMPNGSTAAVSRGNLEFPNDRSFRLFSVSWQLAATSSAIAQVRAYGPAGGTSIACSGPMTVSTGQVLRGRLHVPGVQMFPSDTKAGVVLLALDVLCPQKGDSVIVTYTLQITCVLNPEVVPESCPKSTIVPGPLYHDIATRTFEMISN